MLVEFRVKNFRSFRDEQTLSLVASKDKTQQETHTFPSGFPATPNLLRSAAIYGANASGKSNIIKALQFMRGVVLESASIIQPGQHFNLQPFRLDEKFANEPTWFEITFIIDGVRYQYGFSMTAERVISEHLMVYKAFKPQRWFERNYNKKTDKDEYEYGPALKGNKTVWEGATRPNSLFLSMAVQLNSEQLIPLFDWFNHHLVIMNEITPLSPNFTVQMLQHDDARKKICSFLTNADISISNIDTITRKVPAQNFKIDLKSGNNEVSSSENEITELKFHHTTANGNAVFDLKDESGGTRNLLFLAGPILDILQKGLTLVIDELDNSLHTLLVRDLIRLFHQPESNVANAQLIFTTHDTALLDAYGLFRRDQIWFVEKKNDQNSELYCLIDFSPRKNEALERGYLQGRYGSVPILKPFTDALN